jgi:hypothetical protein
MMRPPGLPTAGTPLLFWDEQAGELQPLLDMLGVVPGGRRYGQPKEHVRRDIPRATREELARALQRGDALMAYKGSANCQICGEQLGSQDLFGHGFVWPEKAEHYVLVHDVWTKECAVLLAALRRTAPGGT